MANAAPPTEFPIVRCAVCGSDVLGYVDLDADDRERICCVACTTPAEADAVRFGDLHAIEAIGFGYVLPEGGCGRPDCGQGRCGRG